MKWVPRRRRARLWAAVGQGLLGADPEADAEESTGADDGEGEP